MAEIFKSMVNLRFMIYDFLILNLQKIYDLKIWFVKMVWKFMIYDLKIWSKLFLSKIKI